MLGKKTAVVNLVAFAAAQVKHFHLCTSDYGMEMGSSVGLSIMSRMLSSGCDYSTFAIVSGYWVGCFEVE